MLRTLAIGGAIALVVLALSDGHVVFLPLLFIPLGLFSFGHRQNRRRRGWWGSRRHSSGAAPVLSRLAKISKSLWRPLGFSREGALPSARTAGNGGRVAPDG